MRQQEEDARVTTDSDSKTTNLLDETLTLAHASRRVDEIADLQSRLEAVTEQLRLTHLDWQLELARADRWRELATEIAARLRGPEPPSAAWQFDWLDRFDSRLQEEGT